MSSRHLAQLNVGRLLAPTDDPRVAEFMDNLDRINGLGKRMPGFVWMMEGSGAPGTGNTQAALNDDPQYVSNLTVWESPQALEKFVRDTVHKLFYQRRAEWFEPATKPNFVMWWIRAGHTPSLQEGLARLDHLREKGDSEHAFGWPYVNQAKVTDVSSSNGDVE